MGLKKAIYERTSGVEVEGFNLNKEHKVTLILLCFQFITVLSFCLVSFVKKKKPEGLALSEFTRPTSAEKLSMKLKLSMFR